MASPMLGSGGRSSSTGRASRGSLPRYSMPGSGGLSDELFINPGSLPVKEAGGFESLQTDYQAESSNYMPPPFPLPSWSESQEVRQSFFRRHKKLIGWIAYCFLICAITAGLIYPIVAFRETEAWTEEETPEISHKQLVFHIFLWLLTSWGCLIFSNICINIFPHAFRIVAGLVNPGQQKYWRIFRFMKMGVTCLGGAVGTYASWAILILNNEELIHNAKMEAGESELEKLLLKYLKRATMRPTTRPWPKIVNDLLTILLLWAVFFFFEKMMLLYVSIHYHYRSDGNRIEHSKRLRAALVTMYEASTAIYPAFQEPFKIEDGLIAGQVKDRLHYFRSKSTSKIVDHALEDPRASAALAKRIWMSLVPEGRDVMTVDDLVEVIKSHRRAEAEECFRALDENQNGDLTLNEMVLTVIETGRARRSIYQGMTDINRAIAALDWICCVVIAIVMAALTMIRFVPLMKGMKDAMGITLVGLSFGFGRTLYEFLNGCIFIFLKHAYDVGDRIEVYNIAATMRTSVIVTRVSILFTVFRRIDNGKELQMSNDRLNMKRIENVTRSGANREEISVFVDFNTTFTDIENLKAELQDFASSKGNSRDYQPNIEVRLNSIFEMNKLELVVSFYHKSNWANEELRTARSSKFKCALLAAIRRVPLVKPGGMGANPAMKEDFERDRENAAYNDFTAVPVASDATTREQALGNTATGAQINSWIGQGATGLRRRPDQFSGGILYAS